jgi:GAF domain-containing protein
MLNALNNGCLMIRHYREVFFGLSQGAVLRQRTPELIANAQSDRRHYSEIDRKTGMSKGSLLAVPLLVGERRLGVIEAVRLSGESGFTEADMAMLEQLGPFIAVALENAGLHSP